MQTFTKIDIISLINNPDTTVVDAVNSEIIEKIKTRFSTEEQKLFASSFYCYLNYDSRKEFIVDLENVWKWLGFSRIDPAKRLIEKKFKVDIDYKVSQRSVEKVYGDTKNPGGRPKDIFLMTINAFKKLCLTAGTSKASDIHDYYISLEEIMHDIIRDQHNKLIESNKQLLCEKQKIEQERLTDKKLERHNVLMNVLQNKNCVYLIEIEGNLVKVGSSGSIKDRRISIQGSFGGKGIFLEVFECLHYREAERNILSDPRVKQHLFRDQLPSGHVSNEVILLSDSFTYHNLVDIIKEYVIKDRYLSPIQILEKQKIEFLHALLNKGAGVEDLINVMKTPFVVQNINTSVGETQNKVDESRVEVVKFKKNNGRRIQQIDPKDLTRVVKVYKNMEALLENKRHLISETGIRDAIAESKVYNKYRWAFVEEGQDPEVVHNIEPTTNKKIFRYITVFELNSDKTKILRHFDSMSLARQELKIHISVLKKMLQEEIAYNNCYYITKENCPQNLIEAYNKPHGFVPKGAVRLKAFDPKTGEEKIFPSMRHAYDFCKIHHKTVRRCINERKPYNGLYWEEIKD
jgi:hypothetical protein